MPTVDIVVECNTSRSTRAQQLEAIFDVPPTATATVRLKGDLPIDDWDWQVGLIVGPSGSGKSTILRDQFGTEPALEWNGAGVIDDFAQRLSMQDVSDVCQAVGFNTIPAWLRPYRVLSNGERFRVDLARRLIEADGTIVIDEFTSVVDRQVAQIGAHAVQKYVRKRGLKFVAASCHYDIVEWLQPDWTLEPSTMTFTRRPLRRRPELQCEIGRISWDAWRMFAPFHYMSGELHKGARCYGLLIEGRLAAFAAVLYRPHPRVKNIYGISRCVTLPDFQGLGLMMAMLSKLGSAYRAVGVRLRNYPAHPSFTRAHDRSPEWLLKKRPGVMSKMKSKSSSMGGKIGGRLCAVFEYCGAPMLDLTMARAITGR